MCGIVGMLSESKYGFMNDDLQRFNQLLVCDSVRGPDSTGVFGVNKFGNVQYLKEKGNPFKLMETDEYQEFLKQAGQSMQFLIGHNRKATIGNISDETAHPFTEGNIILVHNGTLRNHAKLTDEVVEVDSHAITHSIVERGYKETLKDLDGAFTLVWYDLSDKTLRIVRNEQRPLHLIKYNNKMIISSEYNLGHWIASRDHFHVPTIKHIEVTPGMVYNIELNNSLKIEEEPVELYKPKAVVTYPRLVDTTKKTQSIQKKQETGSNFSGWAGFECAVGDKIVVLVTEINRFKNKANSTDPQRPAGYLIGSRIFKDQPPVFSHLTQQEIDDIEEDDDIYVTATVTRLIKKNDHVVRIYVDKIAPYIPQYDITGTEVFNEEWKLVTSTTCRKCGKHAYWKDIGLTRFKFKKPNQYRIVCKECIQ